MASKHGYALQLGFKNADMEFSVAAGTISGAEEREVTEKDLFLFGSGTKPYTALGVMQLVEQGVVKLDDPVSKHIDPVLTALTKNESFTFSAIFGPAAAEVTVGQVISMRSGIADWDVPGYDAKLLANGTAKHSPLEYILNAAAQKSSYEGHFVCKPGTCVCYSSTNFDLAGFVLLRHYSSDYSSWDHLPQHKLFEHPGVTASMFADTHFYQSEPIDSMLTVPGKSGGGWSKATTILHQSSTILGWTCGNMVAPTLDVARFFYTLLSDPAHPGFVSASLLQEMKRFKPLDVGWAKGYIQYGIGLMIQQTSPKMIKTHHPPQISDEGAYIGHGGDTYGFLSEQGWYPALNASIAVVANEDSNGNFVKNTLACGAYQIVAKVLHGREVDLGCGH